MALSKGKIYKYNKQGNFVAEYEGIEAAAFIDKISGTFLLDHVNGKWSFCHDHVYTKKYYIKLPDELLEHKTKRIYKRNEIHQYNLDGKYLASYIDKYEAEEKTGLKARYIRDCASGNFTGRTYGGFMWSYEKHKSIPKFEKNMQYKKIHQFTKDGKFVKTFNSLKEAAATLGVSPTAISNCARGQKKTPSAGGYVWRHNK